MRNKFFSTMSYNVKLEMLKKVLLTIIFVSLLGTLSMILYRDNYMTYGLPIKYLKKDIHQENTSEQGKINLFSEKPRRNVSSLLFTAIDRPLILEWVPPFHKTIWKLPSSPLCGGGCDITRDRTLYEKSDALVFFMKGTDRRNLPDPSKRLRHQVFVWWCHENPNTVKTYWGKNLTEFDNYFNWTMHYRSDSHVTASFIPHTARDWYLHRIGRSEESEVKTLKRYTSDKEFDVMFEQLMKKKRKHISWVVSDCHVVPGAVRRREFAERMKSEGGLEIDIYGKCGNKKIPNINFFDLLQSYKFYLAFENTKYCKDYITEKFWYNSLYAGTVPVVWGPRRSDVEKIAPPHSFIHVDDFNGNLKQLADYLRMLDNSVTEYKKYFRWWTMPGFYPIYNFREDVEKNKTTVSECNSDFQVNGFCHLCKLLHEEKQRNTTNIIPSLKQAFYGKENSECGSL